MSDRSTSLQMAKKLSFREESRKKLVEGINVVANAVKSKWRDAQGQLLVRA